MRTTLIFVALAASALAVPTGLRTTCADHCTDHDFFKYETGKSYEYDYSVTTSTALLGTFDDDAHMSITAKVHIDVSAPCEYSLRLTEVTLDGSSHTEEFAAAISKSPLRFSFQDGRVESVCSEVTEPAWVLNFKRGVLSTFQNSMTHVGRQDVQETDISGVCMSNYKSILEGNVMTVEKVKDLSSCTERPDLSAYIASSGYLTDSPVQSLPIFKSTNKCNQRIEDGVLRMAECEETHKFRPFSSEEGGAVTTAKTTMLLVSQEDPAVPTADYESISKSLVFEQTTATSPETQIEAVEKILNDLDVAGHGEIHPETPALFSTLVASLKGLDYPTLKTIYTNTEESHSRKFLVDAMPLVGTAAAVSVIKDMFVSGEITETETDIWFTSLAFFKNPTSDMFTALVPLMENPSQQAMLGASALVNTYCKAHADCESDAGVQQLLRAIESHLGSGCATINEAEKIKVLVALKALGNAGRWVNANPILQRCYTEDNDMEVRVAAIEAWRHTPCEYDRSNLLEAFQDETRDTEVRIAAYLAVMTCPTPSFIDTIKDRLTSEGVNQVGSFIWTHMTNLQESAAPGKQWVRELIGEELLQKKFNTEALKFSRNYESSFFMNELNAGAAVESNVIFSSKSFLPRSAMLNLTLDLFGESINLFEVGGRIEGLEAYVERFFGPYGYFPQETVEGIIKTMRQQKPDPEATTLEEFLDQATDEPEGSYYLRVFGNELHYNHFHGLENLMKTSGASNPLEILMELARKGDVDYTKSYQLMDAHYTIPTVSGLPVTLTAKGTATLALRMNGNFKAQSLKNINIEGHIHPSAAVQMDGLMVVDAHVTRTGMKISSTLHTSTFLDGKVQIDGGKLVDIAFNTPKEKIEVIDVSTKFFYLSDDQEIQKDVKNKVEHKDCTSGIIGVAMCAGLSYTPSSPNSPSFPYTGPLDAHLYFKKTGTQTGYILRFTNVDNTMSFLFDTPESQVDHKMSLTLTKSQQALNIDLYTPFKTAQGTGEYIWETHNKHIKMELTLNSNEKYSLETGLKTIEDGITKFEPSLVLTSATGVVVNVHGSFGGQIGHHESFMSSKLDIEYSLSDANTHMIHHSALVKKEVSDTMSTYSLQFELTPTQFADLTLMTDHKTIISAGRVESISKVTHGTTAWSIEEIYSYTNEKDHSEFDISLAVKCPQWNIDYMALQNVQLYSNKLRTNSHVRIGSGNDYVIAMVYEKMEDGRHSARVNGRLGLESCELRGNLLNKSRPGKIDAIFDAALKSSVHDVTFTGAISADGEKATTELKATLNGQDYTLMLEGTRTSLLVDINALRHILFNAYVNTVDEAKKLHVSAEWDKDVDPTKAFIVDGHISPVEVLASVKFTEREIVASGKIVDNGVELAAMWAPDKRVLAHVHYSLDDTKSLAITVETPFQGWEKQDVTFTVSLKDYEITSRAAATWKNAEQMALTINGKFQPGLSNNALKTQILFSSSFENFERITFTVDHTMAGATINTNIVGLWNNNEMKGNFQLTPNETGVDARATFISPFTEEVLVTLHHELHDMALTTKLEAKYGAETSTITMKGHVDLGDVHDITLVVKAITPLAAFDANIKYTLNEDNIKIFAEGKVGEKQVLLNMNGEKTVTDGSTAVSGDLKFITPLTYPLTATFSHSHDGQQFTSQLEMTRIWSTFGTLKMHAEGHMISKNDIVFNAILSSPDTKASVKVNHKIAESNLASTVDVTVNGERIFVSINGILDALNNLANLEGEVTSTFNGLDDIKVKIESQKDSNTRTSKFILMKGSKSVNIVHTIRYDDLLNWENSFTINDNFKLRNKQSHLSTAYVHELESMWNNERVHVTGTIDPIISENSRKIDAQINVATTFEYFENINVNLNYEDNGTEYKPTLSIEYKPGSIIEIASVVKFNASSFYTESSLTTPFWQPLGYKLQLDFLPQKTATLVLTRGANKTVININGTWEQGKLDGRLEIRSTYLTAPISVEVMYDITSSEKKVRVAVITDSRYEFSGSYIGNAMNPKWSLAAVLPFEEINSIEFSGEYQIMAMPFTVNTVLKLNSKTYAINGKVDTNEFLINADVNGVKGSLASKWFYHPTHANIEVKLQSPVSTVNNMAVYAMYDFETQKKIHVKLTRDAQEIDLIGKLEGETVVFTGTTPFNGWETLNASFFISQSAINAFIARNDQKIEVTGTLHIKRIKGKIELAIITPFSNYETISVKAIYNLYGETKKVEFKSTFGTEELSLKSIIKVSNPLAPEIKLDIITPFEAVKALGGVAQWNWKDSVKTAEVKTYHNDVSYRWHLEAAAESLLKGYATFKVITPLAGWTDVSVKGSFDFRAMPYKVALVFNKEGVINAFEGNINLTQNNISGEFTTPIADWEKIILNGTYNMENDHLTGHVEFNMGSEKYEVNSDILFRTQTPNLKIVIKTPIADAANIQLILDTNMVDTEKRFTLSFSINDIIYSAEFTGQLLYKTGFIKVVTLSPIPSYTAVDIYANYDFTGDIKTVEINLKKEGEDQHIAIATKVNDNNLFIDVVTPFEGYEVLKMTGDYTRNLGRHSVVASFVKNNQTYDFHADVTLDTNSAELRLSTPIAEINNVIINGKYELFDDIINCLVHFERNDEVFEFKTNAEFHPMKPKLYVAIDTPIDGWSKLILDISYNVISEKKSVELSIQKETFSKTIKIQASHNPESGSFKIETPIEGFEVLGAEYTLSVNQNNNIVQASVKINQNTEEWIFSAYGRYDVDNFIISFQTPFEEFDRISIEGKIDFAAKAGKGVIQFGSNTFSIITSYALNNMFFELATPFSVLKFVSLSASYTWTSSQKDATVTIVYNENNYVLNGALTLSARSSGITLRATTPLQNFKNLTIQIKYDIDNRDELVSAYMRAGQNNYHFIAGGYIEDKFAYCKWDIKSPFYGWTNVKFVAKVDLRQEDKLLEISLEKEENVKAIAISGKLIGSTMDFSLKTPFTGLQNVNVFGSLDRVKRSVEFRMMNDAGEASLVTSFNFVKLHLKTPFERAREITWEITKINENSYSGQWRRDGSYFTISLEKDNQSRSFNMEINSELKGWEFLALSGRLDEETLEGYVSGAINEDAVSIHVKGTHASSGEFNLEVTTPYQQYKKVEGKLVYGGRQQKIHFEAKSTSSEFHYMFELSRRNGLQSHLLVPNRRENTELNVQITPFLGKITFVSRFAALRNFHLDYQIAFADVITVTQKITVNDLNVFNMVLEHNKDEDKTHLEIHTRHHNRHTMIHIHYESGSIFNFIVKVDTQVNNETIEREFKVDARATKAESATENEPFSGTINAVITNTFQPRPQITHVKIELNRSLTPKTVRIEISRTPNQLYKLDISYNIDITNPFNGNFDAKIYTPNSPDTPWKTVSGSWNVQDPRASSLTFTVDEVTYTVRGKVGLRESTMTLTASNIEEMIFLQWKFEREGNYGEYFLKFGRESSYSMLKLKGTFTDIAHVDLEGGFKAGPYQEHEVLFETKWNKEGDNIIGGGSFNYDNYHGTHTLEIIRGDPQKRAATVKWTANSNYPDFQLISLFGNYDFDGKLVFLSEVRINDEISKIEVNITNFNPKNSRNTIEWNIPILSKYGPFLEYLSEFQLTLTHNFRKDTKIILAVAVISKSDARLKVHWTQSDEYDTFTSGINMRGKYFGAVRITGNYDVSNAENFHAEVTYSRNSPANGEHTFSIKWKRQMTSGHFESEIIWDSSFATVSHARVYVVADFIENIKLISGLEANDKVITAQFDMSNNSVSGKITTPFEGYESIESLITYSLLGKNKSVVLKYEGGGQKIDFNFTLNKISKKRGDFTLNLKTPFEMIRTLNIEGRWGKKGATLDYQRNDNHYSFTGEAEFQGTRSDFDFSFKSPESQTIRIAASYNVQDFIAGTTSNDQKLASLEIEFEGYTINFDVHGFRSSERIYMEMSGKSSLVVLREFHLMMNSEIDAKSRDEVFEIKLNEFEFKTENHFERHENDGFYFKNKIESTLTPLPALIFGLGKEDGEYIVTVGYGNDQELTVSIKGKNNFKSGFSGSVDIPAYGYEEVRYDVDYGFTSDDELHINVDIKLNDGGKKIEADFIYNSEGVKARLASPATGDHSVRVRRSISSNGFFTEVGFDDYNLKLRGGFKDEDTKRGAVLEGDIFGNKFLIDFLFQSQGMQYSEGKLIIHTPFRGMENMGGLFTLSNVDNKIMAHVEVLLPSYTTPKISGEVNLDLNEKLEGFVTLDVAGEKFILQSKLIGLSLSEGYEGTLQLTTPFHALPHLLLNVSIKMVDWSSLVAKFTVNENTIIAQYTMGESTFKFNLDTMVETVHRQLSLEAVYPSLENLEGVLNVVNGDEVHKLRGNFNIISNRVQGGMELESPLTTVTLKLNFDIAIPNASHDHIIFNVSLTTSETYSLFFELDTTTGVLVTVKIDTPVLPKLKATLQLAAAQAALKIETPQGVHEIHVTWRLTMDLPVDWLATLHLVSPLLTEEYTITLMLNGEKANMMLKGDLQVGGVKHAIEGKSVMTDTSGELSLNIETPYKNINRLALAASMSFGEKIEMHINGTQADNVNTLDVIFDTINKSFRAMVSSPLIPTGQVSIEALLTGNMGTNMKLKMALKYGDNTISGVLIVKLLSPENMSTILKITTPFKGYKHMNFVARYLKDEVTNIVLSLDKPLRINVELHLSNKHDTIMADMKIETAIENFEMIKAKVEIPLSVFAPSVLVNVDFDDTSFGANLGLRTKAPYELALGCHATDVFSGKFHLRMDSSFLSVLA